MALSDGGGLDRADCRSGFALQQSYLRPFGKPEPEQPWSAMVWKKQLSG
jgi:hypothetical protein